MQYSRSASTSNCVNSSVIPFSQDIRTSRMHCTDSSDIQWRTIQNNKIIIPKMKLWQQYLSDHQKMKNVKTICEGNCSRSYPFANIRSVIIILFKEFYHYWKMKKAIEKRSKREHWWLKILFSQCELHALILDSCTYSI